MAGTVRATVEARLSCRGGLPPWPSRQRLEMTGQDTTSDTYKDGCAGTTNDRPNSKPFRSIGAPPRSRPQPRTWSETSRGARGTPRSSQLCCPSFPDARTAPSTPRYRTPFLNSFLPSVSSPVPQAPPGLRLCWRCSRGERWSLWHRRPDKGVHAAFSARPTAQKEEQPRTSVSACGREGVRLVFSGVHADGSSRFSRLVARNPFRPAAAAPQPQIPGNDIQTRGVGRVARGPLPLPLVAGVPGRHAGRG
ncbi:hypothetical protein SAMN00790413_04186 [Deinococcus hopiensis KR-140]|uniref:Uncharacterized protein n=1 Tax=Deinococcus hopiensis KR-140 TaxID=695939 RepID=A0A1W1UPJ8_9DEIO|nr:hypothetical protein SAMN00790413_04186 [Deinococcus hopiensis KR-140]